MRWALRQNTVPYLCLISMKHTVWTHEYLTLCAENMIRIDQIVSEICPVKVKSQEAYVFKQVRLFSQILYLKYG